MLKSRQMLGKYRIEKRVALGGFAAVYQALDTIEGLRVALKIPHDEHVTAETLRAFRHEARLVAGIDHPNILPIKDASIIDGRLVIAMPLGETTLLERWRKRMTMEKRLDLIDQMLRAVAHAHERKIVHCDIKPENFILFSDQRLRLADFGIARIARRTLRGSGSGTVGYMSPDQAMGRPSLRSDVFSLGLLIYRLMTGELPEWPFEWPLKGADRLKRAASQDLIRFLQKSLEVNPRRRYAHAGEMLAEFEAVRDHALKSGGPELTVHRPPKTTRPPRITPARRRRHRSA